MRISKFLEISPLVPAWQKPRFFKEKVVPNCQSTNISNILLLTYQTAREPGPPVDYGRVHRSCCSRGTATVSSRCHCPTGSRCPCGRTGGRRPSHSLIEIKVLNSTQTSKIKASKRCPTSLALTLHRHAQPLVLLVGVGVQICLNESFIS